MMRTQLTRLDTHRGALKNGNPSGDLSKTPRCGAKTRDGTSCLGPAMRNGRCRMHGGASTGPRTPEGLERCRQANWKHGGYSTEAIQQRRDFRQWMIQMRKTLTQLNCC